MVSYEDFKKIELRTAKVVSAERVENSDKLIKLELSLGEERRPAEGEVRQGRQIVAGIGKKYAPDELVGKTIIVVANLEPRSLMGLESQGMLLAASNESEGPVLLTIMEDISEGSEIR
jgi:methionyl-tRNA synthetase